MPDTIAIMLFGLVVPTPTQIGDGLIHLAVSRDSSLIFACSEDGVIVIREKHGKVMARHEIDKRDAFVSAMNLNPMREDQLYFATLRGLFVWEWKNGNPPRELLAKGPAENKKLMGAKIDRIASSPNGKLIAVLDMNQRVVIVQAGTKREGAKVLTVSQPAQLFSLEEVYSVKRGSVRFSPDSSMLAQTAKNDIALFDMETHRETRRLKGHTDIVGSICFLNNDTLLSGGSDSTCRIWNVRTGDAIQVPLPANQEACPLIAISPDGKRFVCACDELIKVFSYPERKEIRQIQGPKSGFTGIAFLNDSNSLISTGEAPYHRIWNIEKGREVAK